MCKQLAVNRFFFCVYVKVVMILKAELVMAVYSNSSKIYASQRQGEDCIGHKLQGFSSGGGGGVVCDLCGRGP